MNKIIWESRIYRLVIFAFHLLLPLVTKVTSEGYRANQNINWVFLFAFHLLLPLVTKVTSEGYRPSQNMNWEGPYNDKRIALCETFVAARAERQCRRGGGTDNYFRHHGSVPPRRPSSDFPRGFRSRTARPTPRAVGSDWWPLSAVPPNSP